MFISKIGSMRFVIAVSETTISRCTANTITYTRDVNRKISLLSGRVFSLIRAFGGLIA